MSTHSSRKLAATYSGNASKVFWRRVNRLKEPDQSTLYAAGCLLQTLEGTVLLWLANAEVKDRSERKRR